MKTTDRSIEVADLDAVAHFGEDLVIFIYCEEDIAPASLSVQADFHTLQFGPVQPLAAYLELNSYQPIHDGDTQISFRKRIQEEMDPEVIAVMLNDFTQKQLLKPGIEGYDYSQGWQPGG
jgi:hypothetical protein